MNEAEYRVLLLGFDFLADQTRESIIIWGDSNSVIRQMRGEIDSEAPGLQLLRHKAIEKLRSWPIDEFLHMKRELYRVLIDRQARLCNKQDLIAFSDQDRQGLCSLNRLDELLIS